MPTIVQASIPVTDFPNLFISPFGNDGIIPLYSSIPFTSNNTKGSCLPCVVCGNSITRNNVISIEANNLAKSNQPNSISIAIGT